MTTIDLGVPSARGDSSAEHLATGANRFDGSREVNGEAFRLAIMPTDTEIVAGRRRLHVKAVSIVSSLVVGYSALLNGNVPVPVRAVCFPIVIVSLIMVATSIMHDANHFAFFGGSHRANKLVGFLADLLGVSSALWRIKHDIHHADTNVQGVDVDIDQGAIARLAPEQPHRVWHQWQHLYMWPLYGLMGIQWLLISDFTDLIRGHIAGKSIRNIPKRAVASIFLGKALHVLWALILPMVLFPWFVVLPAYLVGSWVIGSVLAVTFQIAHCVDNADFTTSSAPRRGDDYVWHQLRTTVNVAPSRSVLGRLRSVVVGGLDYQIEHHLAPNVPHTTYAAMAQRLRLSCADHAVQYRTHSSVKSAIKSHSRWLKQMGSTPVIFD
jgi:linoleoyl-CoA desaturase